MALEKVGVRATIEGLNAFNNGMQKMGRSVEGFGKETLTASKRTEILTGALRATGLALTAAAAASGALLFSSVKLAARVETLGVVTVQLGKNVGKTEKEIRDLEKAVVAQGITLQGARKAIALMIQSNVDLASATDLARLAQNAAVIAGVNSSEAFERLVFVITSGNVRMARTLGLQVSFAQGMEKMAEATGKTAAELTPLERIQARTNEVLGAGVNIAGAYEAAMGTVGKAVFSLDRFVEASRRTLGETWLPTYKAVVDFITKTLESWLALDQATKDATSSTLGMVIALTAVLGVTALAASAIPRIAASFQALAGALSISAVALGAVLVAVVAVGAAFAMVIKTINRIKIGMKLVTDAIQDQEKQMLKTADTFEDYRKEMERVGKVTKKVVGTQDELKDMFRRGEIGADKYRRAIVLTTEKMFDANKLTMELTEGTSDLARAVTDADEKFLRTARGVNILKLAEEEWEAQQEGLLGQLDALQLTISTDITPQFEDFKTKVNDLTAEIAELEGRKYLTNSQKAQLEDTREELAETQKAWDRATAQLIFNLAKQRLAMGDIAPQEAFDALRKLAGPEGLGLVDEAGAALIEKIDLFADALGEAGDQSDIFGEDLTALQAMMLDPTIKADELADAIERIKSKDVTVRATFIITEERRAGEAARRAVPRAPLPPVPSPSGFIGLQHGGFAQAGRAAMVGETGAEIFVPRQSGTVLSNRFVGAISSLVAALKSAPALMAAPMTPGASSSVTNNEFTMNINTRAPSEPIIADFRTMQSMANAT